MKKTLEWWGSRGYKDSPTVSFVLSTHNLSGAAMRVIDDLRQFDDAEIIVVDDGSSLEHTELLLDYLNGVNEFLLHYNDLFDVIVLNRAIGFARGKYVAIIQDDDKHNGKTWVVLAVQIMNNRPRLAVLGGRDNVTVSVGGRPKIEPRDVPFRYAQVVNTSPMWVRRDVFLELGGLDMDFAPMLWHEGDLCFRAWLSGYHVGWYKSTVDACAVPTVGRRRITSGLRSAATAKNYRLLMDRYALQIPEINARVKAAK